MDVRFVDSDLERLEWDTGFNAKLAASIVRAFRKKMQMIRAAPDERTFYQLKSLHFEKLKGDRAHQHSMRLNIQWRLIIEFEERSPSKQVAVISIEDYH
jgi:proteic killer suppression protein